MLIRIEATDLPGRTQENVHIGVQSRGRPDELLGLHPGDAPSAVWTLECDTKDGDITGRHVQGGPRERFIYLSWGRVGEDNTFTMFRRAKLMFDGIEPGILENAARSGVLVARLGLTDTSGQPLCAAVRPPLITWSAASA
ncbi:DUF5990 family protein [Actinomadura sp. 9N407]|uniref:DUF5990 family protein n=1 Tax=Actinomadura sp. 9N407 TaxID=3375154 RepID=UPI0037AEFC5E